jgi:hypothetical protein
MYVCIMYVCLPACMYVCMCVCVYIYIYAYSRLPLLGSACVCACVYVYVCVRVYIYIYIYTYIHMYMFIYVYVYMGTCIERVILVTLRITFDIKNHVFTQRTKQLCNCANREVQLNKL